LERAAVSTDAEPPIIHIPTLWEQIDGDRDLLGDVAELFRDDCPKRLDDCRAAVTAQDAEKLARSAHSIKGAASTLAAQATYHAAYALEKMGQVANFGDAPGAIDKLDGELKRLFEYLDKIDEWAPA